MFGAKQGAYAVMSLCACYLSASRLGHQCPKPNDPKPNAPKMASDRVTGDNPWNSLNQNTNFNQDTVNLMESSADFCIQMHIIVNRTAAISRGLFIRLS